MIDEDLKIRKEILRYLNEMSHENIMEFSDHREFERHFFSSLVKKPEIKKIKVNPLEGLPVEMMTALNAATFSKDAAIQDSVVEIEVLESNGAILRASLAKVFGRVVTELVSKNVAIQTLVTDANRPQMNTHLDAIRNGEKKALMLMFQSEKNEIWVAEVSGQYQSTEKKYVLTITEKTRDIAIALGKEADPKDKKPVEEKKVPIDLVIFRNTNVQDSNPKIWVTKTATLLKKAGLWPTDNRTRFIVLRYEDDAHEKAEYSHPFIDDLLCFPLDRLIFLQKVEFVMALPKKVSPSYLFVQETQEKIEIAKRIHLERINDLGLAMANPFPLEPGTPGHFYFRFPGQKPLLDVHGKVMHSTRHPEREGEFIVYFAYFGLSKANNREIREYLRRDPSHKNYIDQDAKHFEFNYDNIFLTEDDKKKKTVVVLDSDEASARSTADYARREIGNVDVVWDDTYYGFFKTYLDKKAMVEKTAPATQVDFFADTVSFLVGADDNNFQMSMTPVSDTDMLLGHSAKLLFAQAQSWLQIFDGDTRNQLTEILYLVQNSKRVKKDMELRTAAGEKRIVNVEFIFEEPSRLVRMNLKAPEAARTASSSRSQIQSIQSFETLVIDYALLPENIAVFRTSIVDALKAQNIPHPPGGPKIIVVASDNQPVNFKRLLDANITSLVYRPVEMRRLLYLIAHSMENVNTMYNFENVPWKADNISAKIARETEIVEISEFGCVIKSNGPLKPGSMFYLFKSIYQNAPDSNLCVRVYHSQENESEKGTYLSSALYFGITDAFLKFTRSFIRETYASKKSKEVS